MRLSRDEYCEPGSGYGSKLHHQGTAGLSPCFIYQGNPFWAHILDPQPFEREKKGGPSQTWLLDAVGAFGQLRIEAWP